MKKLEQITVLGLGLLGGSIGLAVLRCFSGIRVVGCTHRAITRRGARELGVAAQVLPDRWAAKKLPNACNAVRGIDGAVGGLSKLRSAADRRDKKRVERLLKKARDKRSRLVRYKMKRNELEL